VNDMLMSIHVMLQVKERPDVGVYVKDLSAFVVNTCDDMDRIMTVGNKNSEISKFMFFLVFFSLLIHQSKKVIFIPLQVSNLIMNC